MLPDDVGGSAMNGKHLDDELPQEGLILLPHTHADAEPPGIDCTDTDTPCVEAEPPHLNAVEDSVDCLPP